MARWRLAVFDVRTGARARWSHRALVSLGNPSYIAGFEEVVELGAESPSEVVLTAPSLIGLLAVEIHVSEEEKPAAKLQIYDTNDVSLGSPIPVKADGKPYTLSRRFQPGIYTLVARILGTDRSPERFTKQRVAVSGGETAVASLRLP